MTPVGAEGIDAYLEVHLRPVEAALERAVASIEPELPDPVAASLRYGVTSGGKRLRPVLCLSAYEACGRSLGEAAYDLAASVELIHAYSLMHDDLPCMDDADLRRGLPTAHREHGEDATMVAGAALIPAAAVWALDACESLGCTPEQSRAVGGALLEAAGAGGMVGGQWLDLLGEGKALGAHALDDLHRRKTGALLEASLAMGGLAAGAPPAVLASLREYGAAIGLAFQIADDILDVTQSAEKLGKNPSDTELAKSTYVSLYGLEEARGLAEREVERALAALHRAGADAPVLRSLARYVVERDR